jgi:electron transfer flavoprotein beta subunit
MRIMVCLKQVLDVRTPLALDRRRGTVTAPGMPAAVNRADIAALEAAMGLKGIFPQAEILGLTVGPGEAERALRYGLARGTALAWRIWEEGLGSGNPRTIAGIIAAAARAFGPSIVLCGVVSEDTAHAAVPALVAESLDWAWVSRVVQVERNGNSESVKVLQRGERGSRLVLNCPLPALLAVDPGLSVHQYVSVRRLLQAEKTPVQVLTPEKLGIPAGGAGQVPPAVKVVKVRQPKPRTKRTAAPAQTVSGEEMMWQMISGGSTKSEKSNLVQGPPEELAERILDFVSGNISLAAGRRTPPS